MRVAVVALSFALFPGLVSAQAWTGNVNASASFVVANRDTQSVFFSARATSRLKGGDVDLRGLFAHTRQEDDAGFMQTTENRWTLSGRYDKTLTPRMFGFISQRLDHDGVLDLDLRSVSALGLGYIVLQSDGVRETGKFEKAGDVEWRLSGGLAFREERFGNDGGRNSSWGLDFASAYRRRVSGNFFVRHDASIVPAINDLSNFFLSSELALDYALNSKMTIGLGVLYDYTSEPAPGVRKDTSKFVISLGYRF